MASPLASRLTKGAAANAFGQGANLFIQLSSVPLFLFFWGANLYGEWLILFAIPAYLSLSDVGFAAAATHQMTMLVGGGKKAEAITVFHSTSLLVLCLSICFFVLILLAVLFAPLSQWFSFSQISPDEIRNILLLLSLQVLVGLQTSVLYAGYNADGQYGLGMFILTLIRLLEFVFLALTVIFGGGPELVAAAFLSGRCIGFVILKGLLHRKISWLEKGMRRANKDTLRALLRPSLAFMGFPLGNFFNIQGLILIVGAIAGPVAVVVFTSLRTLTRITTQVVTSVNSSVRPEVSRAFGERDFELLRKIHRRAMQVSIWCATGLVLFLAIFGGLIVEFWTAGRVQMDYSFFALLLATVAVNSVWWGSLSVLYGTNNHQRLALYYTLANAVFVALAYPMLLSYGLNGAAMALLAIEIVLGVYTIGHIVRFLEESPGRLFSEVIRPPMFLLDYFKSYVSRK
jgi:O-antigen/teichoic acid export membrane protein